jgi:uridine kinase
MSFESLTTSRFFDAQAAEIAQNYGRGRPIVGIDGFADTAGFSAGLAAAFERRGQAVFQAQLADFQRPRAVGQQPESVLDERFSLSRYDAVTLRRVLVEPFRLGGSAGFVLAAFDAASNTSFESRWITAAPDAILLLAGPPLAVPELTGLFNYLIFLEAPIGDQPAEVDAAWDRYLLTCEPRFAATAIVDTSGADAPRRVLADFC